MSFINYLKERQKNFVQAFKNLSQKKFEDGKNFNYEISELEVEMLNVLYQYLKDNPEVDEKYLAIILKDERLKAYENLLINYKGHDFVENLKEVGCTGIKSYFHYHFHNPEDAKRYVQELKKFKNVFKNNAYEK